MIRSAKKLTSSAGVSKPQRQDDSFCLNSKKYILVIEDDYIVTEIISEALSKFFNCEVLTANLGCDALDLYKTYADDTFCVILDYGMPDMHASRILTQIKEISELPKVILASGYPETIIFKDLCCDQIDTFIPKPFSPMKLVAVVKELGGIMKLRERASLN